MAVATLRKWYRAGKIEAPLRPGPFGEQRYVRLSEVEAVRANRERFAGAGRPQGAAAAAPAPPGTMLVPLDAWERVMGQLGQFHDMARELGDAREAKGKAETEAAFLREQLQRERAERAERERAEQELRAERERAERRPVDTGIAYGDTGPGTPVTFPQPTRRRWWQRGA